MAKIRKKPTDIFRLWRWESEFDPVTLDSLGNIEKKLAFAWVAATWNDLARAVKNNHRLAVCIRVVCMNDREDWEVSKELRPDNVMRVPELEEFYFQERLDLVKSQNKAHIVDVGWVIQTYSNPNQIDNDKWWRVGSVKATKERQQLWRYYHNKVKEQKAA